MTKQNTTGGGARAARKAPLLPALALLALALLPGAARAQWTQPDAKQNINNTNTGNVGVGTANPTTAVEARGTGSFGGDVLAGAGGLASAVRRGRKRCHR